jgi:hypothetical protein
MKYLFSVVALLLINLQLAHSFLSTGRKNHRRNPRYDGKFSMSSAGTVIKSDPFSESKLGIDLSKEFSVLKTSSKSTGTQGRSEVIDCISKDDKRFASVLVKAKLTKDIDRFRREKSNYEVIQHFDQRVSLVA